MTRWCRNAAVGLSGVKSNESQLLALWFGSQSYFYWTKPHPLWIRSLSVRCKLHLDKACAGRTAIIVAHRLTTVTPLSLVLDKGIIRESGTHDELVAKGGLYAIMLNSQNQPELTVDSELNEELQTTELTNANKDLFLDNTAISNSKECQSNDQQENVSVVSSSPTLASHISSVITTRYKTFSRSAIVRILRLNRPELAYIICGCVCCVIVGASQPAFALLYSEVFQIFALRNNPPLMRSSVQLVSGLMVLIGVLRFLSSLGEVSSD
ncbi:hypothetical protein AHF37_07508 [Paragonimus kellicotti]|nr:hypothetical protein AHF37_07508 [Paragonimus kellicotti]